MESKELGDKPESHVDARELHANIPIPPGRHRRTLAATFIVSVSGYHHFGLKSQQFGSLRWKDNLYSLTLLPTRQSSIVQNLQPVPTSWHGRKKSFVFKDLATASHVFLRDDTVRGSLQAT
jgi:hypothetical protein